MIQNALFTTILLLWAGMLLGISCLEAWVKFKTPSLSKAVGLDVGRTVFRTFHKVQWILWGASCLLLFFLTHFNFYCLLLISIGILLGLQTFWIFPHLCLNVEIILRQGSPIKNSYHALYATCEICKLLLLLGCGIVMMFV